MEAHPREGLTPGDGEAPLPAGDPGGWAPLDDALAAYVGGESDAVLLVRTDVGGTEETAVRLFFRNEAEMSAVETTALARCAGRTLDVGAGAGALCVPLLARGVPVTATEILPRARQILRDRGVPVVDGWDEAWRHGPWDTLLLMMNGLGLAGSAAGVAPFLSRVAALLAPGGRILVDSTDPGDWEDPGDGRAPGEVHMQLGFRGRWGDPFPFVFVGPEGLARSAAEAGLVAEVVCTEADGRYLASVRRGGPA